MAPDARATDARSAPRQDRLLKILRGPIDYSAPSACLLFGAGLLDEPVRGRDPDYAEILAPLLDEAVANARGDFIAAVRSAIRGQIGAGSLSRESVCRALGVNARTLSHRLEALGVTYSGLADEARFEAAQSFLRKDRRISEIAAALGFAEQSAFTRAFKSWSGTTPARWRAGRG
jgi:AraC-like DNA-binding protein